MDTALDGPSVAERVADYRRIAFVSHAGGEIVLRPISRFAGSDVVPRRLLSGDQLAGLTFAQLASAFQGVVEVDTETSVGKILERSLPGAPRLLSFAVDPRGVVTLRALEGHPWAEDSAPGCRVFGQPTSVLEAAGKGFLELEPGTLDARITSDPSTSDSKEAAAPEGDGVPRDTEPEQADRSIRRRAVWAGYGLLCLLGGVSLWTWLQIGPHAPPAETRIAGAPPQDAPTVLPPHGPVTDEDDRVPIGPVEAVNDLAADQIDTTSAGTRQESDQQAAPEEERLDTVAAVLSSAARLGHAYVRGSDDLERLVRAKELCEAEKSCSEIFASTQARVEAALRATAEAYVELVDEAVREFPPDHLTQRLGARDQMSRQFAAHVETRRADPQADPRSMLADLRQSPDGLTSPDLGLLVKGSES